MTTCIFSFSFMFIYVVVCTACLIGIAIALCVANRKFNIWVLCEAVGGIKTTENANYSAIVEYIPMDLYDNIPVFYNNVKNAAQNVGQEENKQEVKMYCDSIHMDLIADTLDADKYENELIMWHHKPSILQSLNNNKLTIIGAVFFIILLVGASIVFIVFAVTETDKASNFNDGRRTLFVFYVMALVGPFVLLPLMLLKFALDKLVQSFTTLYYVTNRRVFALSLIPFGHVIEWVHFGDMASIEDENLQAAEDAKHAESIFENPLIRKLRTTILCLCCNLFLPEMEESDEVNIKIEEDKATQAAAVAVTEDASNPIVSKPSTGTITVRDNCDFPVTMINVTHNDKVVKLLRNLKLLALEELELKNAITMDPATQDAPAKKKCVIM